MISFTWYGHATLGLEVDGVNILVDPFFDANPAATISSDSMSIFVASGTRKQENSEHKSTVINQIDRRIDATRLNFDNFLLSMNAPPHQIKTVQVGV